MEIGEHLGDPFLTSTNSINVGNCLRDQNLLDEALAAYESAGREAQKIQARSIDASGRNQLLGLLAWVLLEVVFQLLRKEVDEETLRPAVRSIVTKLA